MNRFDPDLKVRARRGDYNSYVGLLFAIERQDGSTSIAEPLTLRTLDPGTEVYEPTVRLTNHAAQQLMDELWQCGLRPSEGTGSAGQLAATQRHLEDMRTLVFKDKP